MEKFVVIKVVGDYAVIADEKGETVDISVFLLPEGICEGETIVSPAPLQYERA
ncbi:MAG: hypothetical protein R3Y18_05895 [Bacillota bacterium]